MDLRLCPSSLSIVLLPHRPERIPNAVYDVITRNNLIEAGDLTPPGDYDRANSHFPNFDWQGGLVSVSYCDFGVVKTRLSKVLDRFGLTVMGLIWSPGEDDLHAAYNEIVTTLAGALGTTAESVVDHPRILFYCLAFSPTEEQLKLHPGRDCPNLKMVVDPEYDPLKKEVVYAQDSTVAMAVSLYRSMLVSSVIQNQEKLLAEQERHLGVELGAALNIRRSAPLHVIINAIHLLTLAAEHSLALRDTIDGASYSSAARRLCDAAGVSDVSVKIQSFHSVICDVEACLLACCDDNGFPSLEQFSVDLLKRQLTRVIDVSRQFESFGEKRLAAECGLLSALRMLFFQEKLTSSLESSATKGKKRHSFGLLLRKTEYEDLPSLRDLLNASSYLALGNTKSATALMRVLASCGLIHYREGHLRTTYATMCWMTSHFIERGVWPVAILPCITALSLVENPLLGTPSGYASDNRFKEYPQLEWLLEMAAFLSYSLGMYKLYHVALSNLCARLTTPLHSDTFVPETKQSSLGHDTGVHKDDTLWQALELCMHNPLEAVGLMSGPGLFRPLDFPFLVLDGDYSSTIEKQRTFSSALSSLLSMTFDKSARKDPSLPHAVISWLKDVAQDRSSQSPSRRHTYSRHTTRTAHFGSNDSTRSATVSSGSHARTLRATSSEEYVPSPSSPRIADNDGWNSGSRRSIQSPHAIVFGSGTPMSPAPKNSPSTSVRQNGSGTPNDASTNGAEKPIGLESIDISCSASDVDITSLFSLLFRFPVLPWQVCMKLLLTETGPVTHTEVTEAGSMTSPVLDSLSPKSPPLPPEHSEELFPERVLLHPLPRFVLHDINVIRSNESTTSYGVARGVLQRCIETVQRIIGSKTIVYTSRTNSVFGARKKTRELEVSFAENDPVVLEASLCHNLGNLNSSKVALIGRVDGSTDAQVIGVSEQLHIAEGADVRVQIPVQTKCIRESCELLSVALCLDTFLVPAYVQRSCRSLKLVKFAPLLHLVPAETAVMQRNKTTDCVHMPLSNNGGSDSGQIACAILVRKAPPVSQNRSPTDFDKFEGKQLLLQPDMCAEKENQQSLYFTCRSKMNESLGRAIIPSDTFSLCVNFEQLRAMTALLDATCGEKLEAYFFYASPKEEPRNDDTIRILAFDIIVPNDPYFISPAIGPFSANKGVLTTFWRNLFDCSRIEDNTICLYCYLSNVPHGILLKSMKVVIRGVFKPKQFRMVQTVDLVGTVTISEVNQVQGVETCTEEGDGSPYLQLRANGISRVGETPLKATLTSKIGKCCQFGGNNLKLRLYYEFLHDDPWHPEDRESCSRTVDLDCAIPESAAS
eukprot:gb/GECG01012301.1/.p1 GENE.gb/GECG01012301.1/~~gb/GECG01012301.1/.p1  ORF type:complete len:1327 (+),score=129.18 gb/GECG01012301.1/:1-3981(+)